MEKNLFDPKFVHFMWDDTLNGKEGFFADDIDDLISWVNTNNIEYKGSAKPFHTNNSSTYRFLKSNHTANYFRFFYHDPNYEFKVAHAEGKKLQFLSKEKTPDGSWSDIWCDCIAKPTWNPGTKYRLKPVKYTMMTYRHLAEWLAKGNGQCLDGNKGNITTFLDYDNCFEDSNECEKHMIRRWGSTEWIKPTYDIYVEDCGCKNGESITNNK